MSNRVEMTRQELWELVWSMPLSRAASTFAMSHLATAHLGKTISATPRPELSHPGYSASRRD
jgi:hypothetical protein